MNLYDELNDQIVTCPLSEKDFLPLHILNERITVEKVQESTTSINDDLAKDIVKRAKKVFAILVFLGHQDRIGDLLADGLTDEHLPLSRKGKRSDSTVVTDCADKQTFNAFQQWQRPHVDLFLDKQWQVQAPVFDTPDNHLVLDKKSALPLDNDYAKIGTTDFSNVFQCGLFRSHWQKEYSQADGELLQVAIKELKDEQSFCREQENLIKIQKLDNRHLIKHIATCKRGSSHYVIFPLADGGSLLDYWKRESAKPRDQKLILWALQQMYGLAGAVNSLHHELGGDVNCRHGDLKPANILLFEQDADRVLVIADLGVSSIHEQKTDMRPVGTSTMATTRSYEAPEASEVSRRDKPRARTYDMWSLGCVFLEFTIWLLYDNEAVKNFELNRKPRDFEHNDARFFDLTPTGETESSPVVLDAMEALRADPRCRGTALECLVNHISSKLLVTRAEGRFNAIELHKALQVIVQKAEQDPSFLPRASGGQPAHKVFLKPARTW